MAFNVITQLKKPKKKQFYDFEYKKKPKKKNLTKCFCVYYR